MCKNRHGIAERNYAFDKPVCKKNVFINALKKYGVETIFTQKLLANFKMNYSKWHIELHMKCKDGKSIFL